MALYINDVPPLATWPKIGKGNGETHERIDGHTDPARRFISIEITPGRNAATGCRSLRHCLNALSSCLCLKTNSGDAPNYRYPLSYRLRHRAAGPIGASCRKRLPNKASFEKPIGLRAYAMAAVHRGTGYSVCGEFVIAKGSPCFVRHVCRLPDVPPSRVGALESLAPIGVLCSVRPAKMQERKI
jgi:hypothetical protein